MSDEMTIGIFRERHCNHRDGPCGVLLRGKWYEFFKGPTVFQQRLPVPGKRRLSIAFPNRPLEAEDPAHPAHYRDIRRELAFQRHRDPDPLGATSTRTQVKPAPVRRIPDAKVYRQPPLRESKHRAAGRAAMNQRIDSYIASLPADTSKLLQLPIEVLLRILCTVNTEDYLSLVQTCDTLRRIMQLNGHWICNQKAESLSKSMHLRTRLYNGWTVVDTRVDLRPRPAKPQAHSGQQSGPPLVSQPIAAQN